MAKKYTVKEAVSVIRKLEQIKSNKALFKKACAAAKSPDSGPISSMKELRKVREVMSRKELLTDEDRIALVEKKRTDDELRKMGFTVEDDSDFDMSCCEEEEND